MENPSIAGVQSAAKHPIIDFYGFIRQNTVPISHQFSVQQNTFIEQYPLAHDATVESVIIVRREDQAVDTVTLSVPEGF